MFGFFWIIFSYILGSFPSGYIFGRLSGKKVLEIGWRKTSGSNVFKNVGIWQGVATGVFDVGKGYLAVYSAQQFGFSPTIQIFAGAASVVGHNWSLFLNFAGGRGIGTFIGAFFAISPQILGYAIIPLILFAVMWDAAIGTILFLAFSIFLSFYLSEFSKAGLFSIIILLPVFAKRLSPISEIAKSQNKKHLIMNRLLFDDDAPHGFRLKRIFEKAKKSSNLAKDLAKPIAGTLMVPPKAGWKAAKYGAKLAKKPINIVLGIREKTLTEIGIDDFKKMIAAAAQKIVLHQEEINRINVFPVADKDTGYNLAATLLGIESVISRKNYSTLRELARDVKESAMVNARGNGGMIFSAFLIEVFNKIDHLEKVDALHLSLALRYGSSAARRSVVQPIEGTILDVIKAAAETFFESVKMKKEKNIIKLFEECLKTGRQALEETTEKLEVLKQNNVVDAGGLGFVKILESWLESLKGEKIVESAVREEISFVFETKREKKDDNRKEIVFSLKKDSGFDIEEICGKLASLGDSLDVIESDDKIKFHIHAENPELVKKEAAAFGILEWRVEDFESSPGRPVKRRPLGLVVGETAGLPQEFIEKNGIFVVPFKANFPSEENFSRDNFYEKLRKSKKLPTTTSASFGDFFNHYEKALDKFEKILVITISSRLSGAYSQARIGRSLFKKPEKINIYVFDCFAVGPAEGLIAMRAQELIGEGKRMEEIVEELKIFCPKARLFGIVDDVKYIISGGRFALPRISMPLNFLVQKCGLKPVLGLKDGNVGFAGFGFGTNIANVLAQKMEKEIGQKRVKAAIGHAGNLKAAQNLKKILEKNSNIRIAFVSEISPVIGIHAGPGALMVGFYGLDPVRSSTKP